MSVCGVGCVCMCVCVFACVYRLTGRLPDRQRPPGQAVEQCRNAVPVNVLGFPGAPGGLHRSDST